MYFLAARGYRCIAHDRRGHGRSNHELLDHLGKEDVMPNIRNSVVARLDISGRADALGI